MNMKTAKTTKDINLSGTTVEFEKKDNLISGVIIRDSAGGMLVVRQNGYGGSGIEVLVPAPPKLVGRWRLKGAVGDVTIEELFVDKYSGDARRKEIDLDDTNSTIEKVIVEE